MLGREGSRATTCARRLQSFHLITDHFALRLPRPFGLPPRSATIKPGASVSWWSATASRSTPSRSRLVDPLPPWRTDLVSSVSLNRSFSPRLVKLRCHAVLVMSGAGLWFQVRCLCASGLRSGFPPAGCVDHARGPPLRQLSYAGIPPHCARRLAKMPQPLCLLCRRCVASTPSERPTHQLKPKETTHGNS